jgi:MFS transporter, DHA2 family, methylenomycin A resistance protein
MARGRVRAIALAAMCLVLFMTNLDDTVMNVALPRIQTSLDASMSGLQWILNAYTLPIAALALPIGTLGDIYGRKRVFLLGLTIFTLASAVCGFAPNLAVLIAARSLQGIGAAALIPGTLSILADTYPEPQEKSKAIGIWAAVSGLALIAGPAFGGILIDALGWQSVFFLNLPLGAIAFWLTSRFVARANQTKRQPLDLLGMLLSIVFLASLACAVTLASEQPWQSPLVLSLAAIAFLSLLGFLAVESRSRHPMLPLTLFGDSTFAVAIAVKMLVCFTLFSLLFIFSLFLQQVRGYSATEAGFLFLPLNGSFILASFFSGWLVARLGWRFTITTGLIIASVGAASFLQLNADTESGAIWGNLLLSGLGGGLSISPLASAAMASAPSTDAGIAAAALNISNRLGGVLGIALQGTILSQQLAAGLARSLASWDLDAKVRSQLITNALHNSDRVADLLPASIPISAWQQAFNNAFVSGLHVTFLVANLVLLSGAALIVVFIPPLKGRSHF